MVSAIEKLKPNGYIYWDNSDNGDPEAVEAARALSSAVARTGGTLTYFVGFVPASGYVTQGVLARL